MGMGFGERFRAARLALGVTQREIQRRTGVNSNQLCRIEKGEILPRVDTVERLAKGLGVDAGALVGDRQISDTEGLPILTMYNQLPPTTKKTVRALLADLTAQASRFPAANETGLLAA